MQIISHTPALLGLLLATALAACAPTAGTVTAAPLAAGTVTGAAPRAIRIAPVPQPRLGFNDFTPPNL